VNISVIAAAMSQAEEIGVIVAGKNRQVRNGPNGPNGPNSGYLCVAGSICEAELSEATAWLGTPGALRTCNNSSVATRTRFTVADGDLM